MDTAVQLLAEALAADMSAIACHEVGSLSPEYVKRAQAFMEAHDDGVEVDQRPAVPEGMETHYLDLKDIAGEAKRNDGMDPDWWVNMCKWAWDESVVD